MTTPTPAHLFDSNVRLAEKAASRMVRFVHPHASRAELLSAALEGLWLASRSYDSARGKTFATHAHIRIRGAMLDWLRKNGDNRRLDGRLIHPRHHARHLTDEDDREGRRHVTDPILLAARQRLVDRTHPGAELELRDLLAVALRLLEPRDRLILELRYRDDLTLAQIGPELGLTESSICSRHKHALARLREVLLFSERRAAGGG